MSAPSTSTDSKTVQSCQRCAVLIANGDDSMFQPGEPALTAALRTIESASEIVVESTEDDCCGFHCHFCQQQALEQPHLVSVVD